MSHSGSDDQIFHSSHLDRLAQYYQNHPIPLTFEPRVVIASIVVSMLGASTTLLLLGRRTAASGFKNLGLLVLAAVTMASVGIWGMHFIGMNMTLRPSPEVSWYIHFDPGFTILSLFVPMLSLILTFIFVGTGPEALPVEEPDEIIGGPMVKARRPRRSLRQQIFSFLNARLVIGGILFGGTVALMHYSAGFHASFRGEFVPYKVALSVGLACVASTAALTIFFRFQSQWQHNWWKRFLCASVLTTGVCGMHYLGLSGTHWYVPRDRTEGFFQGKESSIVITIAISVMSLGVFAMSTMIHLYDFLVTRESRRKARRVVIASATFDKTGRVLVNSDGMLPMCEVETDLPLKDITQELSFRQPTFQWLYALSWDWSIIDPFISHISARSRGANESGIKARIHALRNRNGKEPGNSHAASKSAAQVALFKERCLESTYTLSQELGLPLSKMGRLLDGVLRTGTRAMPSAPDKRGLPVPDESSSVFSASVPAPRNQGIMLFLVRELSEVGDDTFESCSRRGFRFAEPRWLSPILADRAGVSKVEIDGLLDHLKLYCKRGMASSVRSGGTYLGFFAVRPSISREGGVDSLVYQFARHQIPAYRLPDVQEVTDEMRAWVISLSGQSMKDVGDACLNDVNGDLEAPTGKQAEEMWIFKSSLILAMDAMTTSMPMFHNIPEKSFLSAEIVDMPSSNDDTTSTASMIIFQAAFPAPVYHGHELPGSVLPHEVSGTYQKQDSMPTFTFVPYTLFTKAQTMLLRGSAARKFAKDCRSDLMKRYAISPQTLQAYMAVPEDQRTSRMGGRTPTDLGDSEYLGNGEVHDEERDQVSNGRNFNSGEFEGTTAQREAKTIEARSKGASEMSGSDDNSNGYLLQQTIDFGDTFHSDSLAAPAYSPPQSHAISFFKPDKGIKQQTEHTVHSLFPPPRRPRTANNTDANATPKAVLRNPHPSTSGEVGSGSDDCDLAGPDASSDPLRPSLSPSRPSFDHSSSKAGLSRSFSKPTPQPLAITARLRSDDWYSRCMDGLEHSPAGQELLGVDW